MRSSIFIKQWGVTVSWLQPSTPLICASREILEPLPFTMYLLFNWPCCLMLNERLCCVWSASECRDTRDVVQTNGKIREYEMWIWYSIWLNTDFSTSHLVENCGGLDTKALLSWKERAGINVVLVESLDARDPVEGVRLGLPSSICSSGTFGRRWILCVLAFQVVGVREMPLCWSNSRILI